MENPPHGENPETPHKMTVTVNGRTRSVSTEYLSYDDVIRLAFDPPPTGPDIMFTVTYRRGPRNKPEGSLVEGDSVKVVEGMIFNVTATDKS